MRMNRKRAHLLIIDMQDAFLNAVNGHEGITANCIRLVTYARKLAVPITVSEQNSSALGSTSEDLCSAIGNEATVLEKLEFSCMDNAALREQILTERETGRDQIVVAGIESHVCVGQTVMDLLEQDFDVFMVADATGARSEESRILALQRLDHEGAEIVDTEMVMFEWLERAGTPEFKELQQTIK